MPRALLWCPEPKAHLPCWQHSCRLLCQAILVSEGLLGKKPEPPQSLPVLTVHPRQTLAATPKVPREEPTPGLGLYQLMLSAGGMGTGAQWCCMRDEVTWVWGLKALALTSFFTLTRVCSGGWGFFSFHICSHIFLWLVAIEVCHHVRNCQWLVGETCGFKHGFVGGHMRKRKSCGCSGLLRLPRRGCQHGWRGWIQNMYNLHFITHYWRTCTSCLENGAVITKLKSICYKAWFWPHCKAVLLRAELMWSSNGHALIHRVIQQEFPNHKAVVFLIVAIKAFVRLPNPADFSCLAALWEENADPTGTHCSHNWGKLLWAQTYFCPWRTQTAGKDIQSLSRRWKEAICSVSSPSRLCFSDTY